MIQCIQILSWKYAHDVETYSDINQMGVNYANTVVLYYVIQTLIQPSYYYCFVKEHRRVLHRVADTFLITVPFILIHTSVVFYAGFLSCIINTVGLALYIGSIYLLSHVVSSHTAQTSQTAIANSPHEVFHTIISYLFVKLIKPAT